jgi:hypothetical protein
MNKIRILVAALVLVAIAAVAHSETRALAQPAKAQACRTDCANCAGGTCCH